MKPTVIPPGDGGNGDDGEGKGKVKPTVIPTAIPKETAPAVLAPAPTRKPTVIAAEAPPPDPPATVPQPPPAPRKPATVIHVDPAPAKTAPVSQPTAIPGLRRERIAVTPEELLSREPSSADEARERAITLIHAVNVEALNDRTAIMWGHDLQTQYAQLVGKCLEFTRAEPLTKSASHVDRMTTILGSIDLKKVCGLDGGGMFSFLSRSSNTIDTPAELAAAQVELGQLVRLMGDRFEPLLALKEEIESVSSKIVTLGKEAEASAMAAAFVADHIATQHPDKGTLAQRFMERSASLTQTLAQIRSGDAMRETQIEQPLRLIAAVQHAANVAMPGWLGSVAAVVTMLESNRKPTVTELEELGGQASTIVEVLKGT